MAREIAGTTSTGVFAPTVRLETKGDTLKGEIVSKRVLPPDQYGHNAPVISLSIMELEGGTTTRFVSKGVYEDVDVNVGDVVEFIGNGTDLREKLPQLNVGDVVTIVNDGTTPKKAGRNPKKLFKVTVE